MAAMAMVPDGAARSAAQPAAARTSRAAAPRRQALRLTERLELLLRRRRAEPRAGHLRHLERGTERGHCQRALALLAADAANHPVGIGQVQVGSQLAEDPEG